MRAHALACLWILGLSLPAASDPSDGLSGAEIGALLAEAGIAGVTPPQMRGFPACTHSPHIGPRAGDAALIEFRCDAPAWHRALPRAGADTMGRAPRPRDEAKGDGTQSQGVILSQSLRRGTILTEDHLTLGPLPQGAVGQGYAQITDLIGRQLSVNMGRGQMVLARHLARDYLIHQGQSVAIRAQEAGFSVSMAGEALQSGQSGEMILVRNLRSGREILARVQDSSNVIAGANMN